MKHSIILSILLAGFFSVQTFAQDPVATIIKAKGLPVGKVKEHDKILSKTKKSL